MKRKLSLPPPTENVEVTYKDHRTVFRGVVLPEGYSLFERCRASHDASVIHVQANSEVDSWGKTICGQTNSRFEYHEDQWMILYADTPDKKFCRICNARLRKMLEGGRDG
jgi:hypothetical protein